MSLVAIFCWMALTKTRRLIITFKDFSNRHSGLPSARTNLSPFVVFLNAFASAKDNKLILMLVEVCDVEQIL